LAAACRVEAVAAKELVVADGLAVRREIKRAIRQRSLLHLRLDALRLIEAPPGALALVSSLLRYIAVKRDAANWPSRPSAISQCMRSTAEPRFHPLILRPRRDGG